MATPWKEVEEDPRFQTLSSAEKVSMLQRWGDRSIAELGGISADQQDRFDNFIIQKTSQFSVNDPSSNNEELGFIDSIRNAFNRGIKTSSQTIEVLQLLSGGPDEQNFRDLSEAVIAQEKFSTSQAFLDFNNAETTFGSFLEFVKNPVQITAELSAESMGAILPIGSVTAVTQAATGAAIGAAAGSIIPVAGTGIGAAIGAKVGFATGIGTASAAVEFASKFLETLGESGIDIRDPVSLQRAFENDELIQEARNLGLRKGIPIGIFDAVSAGVGGKVVTSVGKGFIKKTAASVGEVAIQSTLGASGELVGQLSAGEEIEGKSILAEALGEIGPGVVEITFGAALEADIRTAAPASQETLASDIATTSIPEFNLPSSDEIATMENVRLLELAEQNGFTNINGEPLSQLSGENIEALRDGLVNQAEIQTQAKIDLETGPLAANSDVLNKELSREELIVVAQESGITEIDGTAIEDISEEQQELLRSRVDSLSPIRVESDVQQEISIDINGVNFNAITLTQEQIVENQQARETRQNEKTQEAEAAELSSPEQIEGTRRGLELLADKLVNADREYNLTFEELQLQAQFPQELKAETRRQQETATQQSILQFTNPTAKETIGYLRGYLPNEVVSRMTDEELLNTSNDFVELRDLTVSEDRQKEILKRERRPFVRRIKRDQASLAFAKDISTQLDTSEELPDGTTGNLSIMSDKSLTEIAKTDPAAKVVLRARKLSKDIAKNPNIDQVAQANKIGLFSALEQLDSRLLPAQQNERVYDINVVKLDETGRSRLLSNNNIVDISLRTKSVEEQNGLSGIGEGEVRLEQDLLPLKGVVRERLRAFRVWMQDAFVDLDEVFRIIEKTGGRVSDTQNTKQIIELSQDKIGDKLKQFEEKVFRPILKKIENLGLTIREVETYMKLRHGVERNNEIAKRNSNRQGDNKFEDGGSGVGLNDAISTQLKEIEASNKIEAFRSVESDLRTVISDSLKMLHDSQLLDDATFQLLANQYQNYVPLAGIQTDEGFIASNLTAGRGADMRGNGLKEATGRRSDAQDVLAQIKQQHEQSIQRSEQARIGQSLFYLVQNNPDAKLWEIAEIGKTPGTTEAQILQDDQGAFQVQTSANQKFFDVNNKNVIAVMIKGKQRFVVIHNDRLANSLKNFGGSTIPAWLKFAGTINRSLALVNTQLNPDFTIPNFARDFITAGFNLSAEKTRSLKNKILRDVPKAFLGVLRDERGASKNSEFQQAARQFSEAGGKIVFFGLGKFEDQIKSIKKLQDDKNKVKQFFKGTFDLIGDINTAVENGTRVSVFKNMVDAGFTEQQAASFAKDITVNFRRKGTAGPTLNSLFLFYNAGVQGSVRLAQAMRSRRVVTGVGAAMFFALGLDQINRAISDEDEDGKKFYDKLPDHERGRNMIIMTGWLTGDKGAHIKIPLPYGYNAFFHVGTSLGQQTRPEVSWMETAGNIFTTGVDSFNPLGGSQSVANLIAPTVIDPFIDILRNEDFAGRPIMPPQNPYNPKPDSQRFWPSASKPSQAIASFLNTMTLGDDVEPGRIDVSPETLDYFLQFAGGGLLKTVQRTETFIEKMINEVPYQPNEIPLVRKVYGRVPSYVEFVQYNRLKENIRIAETKLRNATKTGNKERARLVKQDLGIYLKMSKLVDNSDKALANMRKKLDRTLMNPDVSSGEEMRLREQARQDQIRLMMRVGKRFNELQLAED